MVGTAVKITFVPAHARNPGFALIETDGIPPGLTVIANGSMEPIPHAFVPYTEILPDTADPEKSTVMLFVFVPVAIDAPDGNVHT